MIKIKENILLSEYTTIKLGGIAKYFVECKKEIELIECINFAKDNNLKIQILGGGSNVIFSDEGFNGLIIKIDIKGISIHNETKDKVILKVGAGEVWDDFVKYCVENNYAGVECLSGIPGSAGATPIQNVGAYGQEVKDTIIYLKALDRESMRATMFSNENCLFDYRKSRFNNIDKDKYIITELMFGLLKNGKPEIKYPELKKLVESRQEGENISLSNIMESVLKLRKKKSMILDDEDKNSVSCGSFFVNPFITIEEYEEINLKYINSNQNKVKTDIPFYQSGHGIKIPAAWLIENTGFPKGFKKNGIGISENHNLALVNCGGKAKDLLEFANEIRSKVFDKFKINLEPEPVIVEY